MKRTNVFKIIFSLVACTSLLTAQTTLTFDDQEWNNDQTLSTSFTVDNFNYSSDENFYTNYGYNFDVKSNSLYYVFQNPDTDKIKISSTNSALFNLDSLSTYQVSEASTDSLIIEGWYNTRILYYKSFTNVYYWKTLHLDYKDINKVVIRLSPSSNSELTDYNFDNFVFSESVTGAKITESGLKDITYKLNQNYPNPFNPSTTIDYSIPKAGNVQIKVYDILGNEVATLVDRYESPGSHSVSFNASNFASGIYIYIMRSGGFHSSGKMILLK